MAMSKLSVRTGNRATVNKVPTADGNGHVWVNGPREDFSYEVSIDWDQIHQMALRAARNKGGKSVDGPIQIKIISRKTTFDWHSSNKPFLSIL